MTWLPTGKDIVPTPVPRDRAFGILATAAVLGILCVGRDVLVSITLAVMLSFLLAPVVRGLRRLGLGHASSVLTAVLLFAFVFAAGATVIGLQLVFEARQRSFMTIGAKLM